MAERIPADMAASRRAAAELLPARIAFLGLGLIGGSIASALRAAGAQSRLVAWTPSGRGPADGLHLGLIDEAAPTAEAAIREAGLVVLAGPPRAVIWDLSDLAGELRGAIANGATITDVASTKELIVENASAYQLPFVGGHPMAGRERSGIAAATADLFVDRPWVIVPATSAGTDDIARVDALVQATGARPVFMTADEHDIAAAAISHLPLIVAAALVRAVAGGAGEPPSAIRDWTAARKLAASGWRDMTRLALGDPEMGVGILSTNSQPVAARLRELRLELDAWIEALDQGLGGPDEPWLFARLESARAELDGDPPQ